MNAEPPRAFVADLTRFSEPFDFMRFFEGRTRAVGVFEDRFGRLRMRFRVEMEGRWSGGAFELDEIFTYETGKTERRHWSVRPGDAGTFRATCRDAASDALGRTLPGLIEMRYRFPLPVFGRSVVFDFLDRLYDMGDGRAINRVRVSKWGIRVGELSLCFRRLDAETA